MNIFLDCGFYAGNALRSYIDAGIVDEDWRIYAFEPNPDLGVEQRIKDHFSDYNITLVKEAVWIKQGTKVFHISGREDAAGLKGLTGHTEPKVVRVKTTDFSGFVRELPKATIICSMDIEGAEYAVLAKMIEDGTINKLDTLDIEFHHRFMNDYTDKESQELIDQIEARGVKVKLKVPLT